MKSTPAIAVVILLMACGQAAFAADAAPQTIAVNEKIELNIPAQPIGDALSSFAAQSGLQVMLYAQTGAGITAPKVIGSYSALEALAKLLSNTSLKARWLDDHTVAIQDAEAGVAAETVSALPAQIGVRLALDENSSSPLGEGAADNQKGTVESPEAAKSRVQEIVVTAQKRQENLHDVPISISVLGGDVLDRSSVMSIADALNRVPGVVAFPDIQGGGTQIVVRGVGPSGPIFNGSSPIGYYLDSVPFGLIRSAISPDAGAYDLERVEVLRGPQGTLYGAGGENGVVRILTHDADLDAVDFKARSTLSSTDGGAENYRGDMSINVPVITGKLAVRAVVGYENQSGWIDNLVKKDTNDAQLRTYRLKVNAQPAEDFSVGLTAWSSRNDYGAPSASKADGRYDGPLDQPMSTDYDAYGLKIGYDASRFAVSSMTSYLNYANSVLQDLAPTGLAPSIFTTQDSDVFSQEINLNSTPGSSWRWSAGLIYRNGKDRQFQNFPGLTLGNDSQDRSESAAIFGEIGRRFLDDKWEWTLGLRRFHDDVSKKEDPRDPGPLYSASSSFDSTTPRAVLTWRPNRDITVYGSYAEGFRSGFPQSASIALNYPEFPPLQPDKLHNYEIGAKADLAGGKVSLDTAFYYIKWDGVQQTLSVFYQGNYPTAQVNGESASGAGVDFAVTARPLEGLDLGVNVSWNDLSLDDSIDSGGFLLYNKGDRLNYSPKLTAGGAADYRFPFGASGFEGQFSASANYSSKQINKGLFVTPFSRIGDSMLIARTSFSLNSPNRWTAMLFVDNVNNERGGYPAKVPFPGFDPRVRPRTVGLQVDYHLR